MLDINCNRKYIIDSIYNSLQGVYNKIKFASIIFLTTYIF